MYSKVPVYYYTQNNKTPTGKVGISATIGSNAISSNSPLIAPIFGTLQPLANLLTIVQSETFWLNALGIVAGLVLVFIAIQFILQYETTNLAKGVVKTAVGKG